MSIKDMIKEVEDAAETMIGQKDADETVKEIKEKIEEIGEAAGSILGVDHDEVSSEIREKATQLAKEVEDAADAMISGEKTGK